MAASASVEWAPRRQLRALARLVVLGLVALRHSGLLLRLGTANLRVLLAYDRAGRGWRLWRQPGERRGFTLARVWLPLRRYGGLFRVVPALETPEEAAERARLAEVYEEAQRVVAEQPAACDPITAPSARQLQGVVTGRAFTRLFGLHLSPLDLEVVGRYGSVSLAVADFLEYCGYTMGMAPAAPLALELPGFVAHGAIRHQRLAARERVLALREAQADGLRALWERLVQFVCRVHWSRGDARERMFRAALRAGADRESRLAVARTMRERLDPATQESIVAVLADEMHLRAVLLLAELSAEKHRAQDPDGVAGTSPASPDEFEFMRAAHGLEENLRVTLGR